MTPAPFGAGVTGPGVYLLHFESPVRGSCRHALGQGSQFTRIAHEKRIPFKLGNFWPKADEQFERQLKDRNEAPRLCKLCPHKPRPRNRHKIPAPKVPG